MVSSGSDIEVYSLQVIKEMVCHPAVVALNALKLPALCDAKSAREKTHDEFATRAFHNVIFQMVFGHI